MKIKSLVVLLAAGALLMDVAGCKKEEPTTQTMTDETKVDAAQVADALKEATAAAAKADAEKAAAEVKKGVEAAKDAAPAMAASVSEKVEGIIEKAKALIDDDKYQEALSALNELAGMTLTDAQQKMVDGLKEQIQKALATSSAVSGASAVGKMLKP